MVLIVDRRTMLLFLVSIIIVAGGLFAGSWFATVAADDFNYRVFVAGIGTVEGKWSGDTGIALIGLETRPAMSEEEELKVIDLLIANSRSDSMAFDSDIALVNKKGERFTINAKNQPEVVIAPGALSQGAIIINVPKGVPDSDWLLHIKGGHLKGEVILPLYVVKVK